MLVSNFPSLATFLFDKKKPFRIFGQFKELFKETNDKNWGFALRKKGREKHRWLK